MREEQLKLSKDTENSELQVLLQTTTNNLAQKEKEYQLQKAEITKLQEEKEKAKQYRSVLEKLEIEKGQLEKKVSEMNTNVAESQANANSTDSSYHKLVEEKELAQSQIDFLNSVIVDMQQKNNALKTRLEILEMGILPSDANDLIEEGITKRVVPPRLFCDICDQFDLHDTEDCPRQAQGSPTPPTSNNKHTVGSRAITQDRPYCDICETFGHNTEDCDDAETF
ncbi:Uncharacterized protein GBIM_09761 [Gryllus bimaculatus]|nr:Uncharacterized protein GBIM_09761 [Gryllus bimaculatus]